MEPEIREIIENMYDQLEGIYGGEGVDHRESAAIEKAMANLNYALEVNGEGKDEEE